MPEGSRVTLGEARNWADLGALLAKPSTAPAEPAAVSRVLLEPGQPSYLALQRATGLAAAAPEPAALRGVHADGVAHFRALRQQVLARAPDPYIDGAVGALNVAVDALWDEPQRRSCRARSRGARPCWLGGYAMDALGWHDRARAHFRRWEFCASDDLQYSGGSMNFLDVYRRQSQRDFADDAGTAC